MHINNRVYLTYQNDIVMQCNLYYICSEELHKEGINNLN